MSLNQTHAARRPSFGCNCVQLPTNHVQWPAVHFTWADRRAEGGGDVALLLSKLSDTLALQVYEHIHVPVLQGLRVFDGAGASFLASLCSKLKTRMFSPEDMIIKYALGAPGCLFCARMIQQREICIDMIHALCSRLPFPCLQCMGIDRARPIAQR
jgi:hypothetical protein